MKIQPLMDRVLVEPEEAEKVTPGGIMLPDTAQEKPLRGKVLAVGPGRVDDSGKLLAMSLKAGDTAVYSRHAGHEVEDCGKKYRLIRECDVLGKLEE